LEKFFSNSKLVSVSSPTTESKQKTDFTNAQLSVMQNTKEAKPKLQNKKNKKNKRSKTKESPKHKKKQTPSSEHKSSKTKVPSIQSSQHKEEAKPKESSKQTPPKLLTLNLLRCNRTCFCAAAAAAATTTTAIPLQLQSSRKLHYPKAQNFCFSLQQPNDDFCLFFPFFQKII
jgi:hypothetical protein